MGGSAKSGGGGQGYSQNAGGTQSPQASQRPSMGGAPAQLPAQGGGMPGGGYQQMRDLYQGQGSAPGLGMAQGQGPLGQQLRPQLQDWRQQLQDHQAGGMDKWQQWMERQRPQYSGNSGMAGRFRGGMGRRAITNAGSFSAAQAGQGGPGEEITSPAAVAGAPQSGTGGNAPQSGGQQGGGGGQQGAASQDIIQALRARFGQGR
jgi:hypothetical protein